MSSREEILRMIHSVLQNEESYSKHAQDIVDQIIIKNNSVAIQNVIIQIEKYLLAENRSINEKTRALKLLGACTKMREIDFLRFLSSSTLLDNLKKFCLDFEKLRKEVSFSTSLVGKKTVFGEIKESSQWVSLHDMILEKINMWSNSFGDLFEGKFRSFRNEIEPEITSNRIFNSRLSISMDPGTERPRTESPEIKKEISLVKHVSEKGRTQIPEPDSISKEGIALRNRYIKSQTKLIYTLSYLEETLRSDDVPEIFHDFFETLVQELEPCVREYDEILHLLPNHKYIFNKPELSMFTMEKEFMRALISEYRIVELNLNEESYAEFKHTVLGMVEELKKKSEHSPETRAQHKKTNEIINKVRGSSLAPDETPCFDRKRNPSFTDLNISETKISESDSSKKMARDLRKRASRLELTDYVSSVSSYLVKNTVLNEDFLTVFSLIYQGLVHNHKNMEEINKKDLLSPTSLRERDNLLLKEGEFTNKFIKEYRNLINNLTEKSYQEFRRIILELIERNKASGILSPVSQEYATSPDTRGPMSKFDYSSYEEDDASHKFEEDIRSHGFLLTGIKAELLKAESSLSERLKKFEGILSENAKLKRERASFLSEIKSLRQENENLRKALNERK